VLYQLLGKGENNDSDEEKNVSRNLSQGRLDPKHVPTFPYR
jgi:hypothetical protein